MSSGTGIITFGEALILGDAIIYLRMSDFRDEDVRTFGERERQLRDFAAGLGVPAGRVRVAIENDAGDGGYRPASAYKRPVRVTTATGLVTMRTRRPVFARVLLDLQTGKAGVLICDDVSRIARDERDALDLIDACELGKASAFSPSEDSADGIGSLRITRGGTREEIRSFRERARAAHDYSADISDKVQRGRKRWAGKSYWGGRRPYGRMIDPSAPKHAKRLITVPAEAKMLAGCGDRRAGPGHLAARGRRRPARARPAHRDREAVQRRVAARCAAGLARGGYRDVQRGTV